MKLTGTEKVLLVACTAVLLILVYRQLRPGLMGNPGAGRLPADFKTVPEEKNDVEKIGVQAEQYAKSKGWIK